MDPPDPEQNVEPNSLDMSDPTPPQDVPTSPPNSAENEQNENGEEVDEDSSLPQYAYDDYEEMVGEETGLQYGYNQNPFDTDEAPPNTANEEEGEDQGEYFFPNTTFNDEHGYRSRNDEEEGEDDFYGASVSKAIEQPASQPKMRSRFSMSNQQILDLNDPFNQKAFEDNISRLDHLLENTQQEYCSLNYNLPNPDENDFRLSQALLAKLVYRNELDLAGNFLHQNVGRRLNDDDMNELGDFLASDKEVTRINLAYNNFGDEGAAALSNILLLRPDIYHVNVAHNDFSPNACCQLFESLMQRPPLHSLNLTGIKIGDEGFQWLICLVLCGSGPSDLDISETDITMANFQGLCTAWQCLDGDVEFPKFLVDNPLPIPLEVLAEMKMANNEMRQYEHDLLQRRSLVDLIRHDSGDMKGDPRMETIPDIPSQARLLEKVSATILQGLFEIPEYNKFKERGDALEPTTLEQGQAEIDEIEETAKNLEDTGEVMEEYKKIVEAGCIPFDSEGRPIIVCPSLYSLDVDDFLEVEPLNRGHFIPSPLDELLEKAHEMGKAELKTKRSPEDDTAHRAADSVMNRVLAEAATFSSKTEYGDKSDATQILLSSVLSTCQRAIEMQNSDGEFRDDDLEEIWDVATQEAVRLIYNRIPPERCSLTPDELVAFVRKFMESSNRTLLRLLQNPFIPPFILNAGTLMCRERDASDDENTAKYGLDEAGNSCSIEDKRLSEGLEGGVPQNLDSMMTNHVHRIVMSFLEGAVNSAASIIGTGDPFSFRRSEEDRGVPLAEALEKSLVDTDATEERVEGAVKDFIHAGAILSMDANDIHKQLDESLDAAIDPAIDFLEEAFGQVAHMIIDLDRRRKDMFEEKDVPVIKYAFASRPNRLVVNRPLFQDFEPVMAAKMGDFIAMNTSVKCLHMRKWNLREDGMISLMEGLSSNSNIVLLDLGCNAIGSEGVRGLVKFIQQNPSLKHLLLNNNCLRNPGLKYLYQAFPGSNIEFLNISYNGIGDSLEAFLDIIPDTRIKVLYVLGNSFNQAAWLKMKYLFDSTWLTPDYCDVLLQDVDGEGRVVKNSQIRDMNEWYDVQPIVAEGLYRAPYFEETAHIDALAQTT